MLLYYGNFVVTCKLMLVAVVQLVHQVCLLLKQLSLPLKVCLIFVLI